MDPAQPQATVLASQGARLVYVGDDPERARSLLARNPETIDLAGQTIIPGLIDSHAHVLHEGLRLGQLDVRDLGFEETLAAIAAAVRQLPPGAWLHARGWDQNIWPGREWPGLQELDQVSPQNPVVVDRVDKHSIWVNSQALAQADPRAQGPDPPGGEILRSLSGEPLGVLIGQAMFFVYGAMPPLDGRDRAETLELAQAELLSYGLTTVVDAATGAVDFATLVKSRARGTLKFRWRAYIHQGNWPGWEELTPLDGLCDHHLALDGLKIFSDGSLGSRSAWLLADYADRPGHQGSRGLADAELERLLTVARERRLQVAIHVIGDAAVAQAVAAIARVLGPGRTDRRWRLEHYQVVADEDRERVLAMGLIPSIQSAGLLTDLLMAEDRLGSERLKRAYAWRDILDRGGYLINGSDCPVESANPFLGLRAAVTRQNLAGWPPEGFLPAHRLSRWEALASYTIWAAQAAFQEGKIGVLRPGAWADFAVLDQDYFACPAEAIQDIQVLRTVVGGETVFSRE
jgi:predicted amidohydrolase YtcJ